MTMFSYFGSELGTCQVHSIIIRSCRLGGNDKNNNLYACKSMLLVKFDERLQAQHDFTSVDISSTQLVVLYLAFLNRLIVGKVLQVDANQLAGKFFTKYIFQVILQNLLIEVSAGDVLVELCIKLSKRPLDLAQLYKLALSVKL